MKDKRIKIEWTLLVLLPLGVQAILSWTHELIYFRVMAFVMPIYICGVFVYCLCRRKLKGQRLSMAFLLAILTYGYSFLHYGLQQQRFDAYTAANNLPLDLDGFAPLIMVLIVHAFVYMALGISILGVYIFIKVFQHMIGRTDQQDWSETDDSN